MTSILIVDDQPKNLVAMEATLEGLADRIVTAGSGTDALKRILDEDFAVILLDVQMPGMDGFETAALIRQRERSKNTPIIFVTAFSRTDENVFRGYTIGAVDYLFKPVVPEILKSKVSIFVELSRSRIELRERSDHLERLNERMETILDSVADGIIGVDRDGWVKLANRAARAILGWTEQTMQSAPAHQLLHQSVHDEHSDDTTCALLESLEKKVSLGLHEDSIARADGTIFPGELTSAPIISVDQEEPEGIVLVFRDITERQAAQRAEEHALRLKESEHANRAKDEFLAILSHELRTPMTAILGWSKMIMEGQLDDESFEFAVDSIHKSAALQSQLIEDILDVSRIVTGKLFVDSSPVNLSEVAERAIETVRGHANDKDINLALELPKVTPIVIGDSARLLQVLWNLLTNSIKFTPARGEVTLRVGEPRDGQVVIEVEDTGQGIDEKILPFVFDRFRQAEESSTRSHGGLGLGLGIVRYVTEAHDGSVAVRSEGPGKGATFTVSLPVSEETFRQSLTTRDQGSEAADDDQLLQGRRFLVVDDDSAIRRLLALMIERAGGEVALAESVDDAVRSYGENKPDVVICDIAMPGKDGFDLVRQLREQQPGSAVPLIAFTAFASAEDRRAVLEAGFDGHLAKPVNGKQLLKTIQHVLGPRPAPESLPVQEERSGG
ncbi:MAG: response regulator [Acidobacteria bacterium]|nr:response regulator [Acidobacteriota bacterium]